MEAAVFIDSTHGPAQNEGSSSQFEVMLDPHDLESNFSDMLLQVVGSEQGITGVHVDSVQRGGVPLGVLTSALASGWQGVKEQHSKMKPCVDQVRFSLATLCCLHDGCPDVHMSVAYLGAWTV